MLLFLLIVCVISNLVTANPLFYPQQQCLCGQDYDSQIIPLYFQQADNFDPYLQAATVQNPVVAYPTNHAQNFNLVNQQLAPNALCLNQATQLVGHSYNLNHEIPVVIDNSYDFSNRIPQVVDNTYSLPQGSSFMGDNSFLLNQRIPAVDTSYNWNPGFSFVENQLYNDHAAAIGNTPLQRHDNEHLNLAVPKSSSTGRKALSRDTKKALIETLMSNPTLKNLIDPNTKLYNQDGVEVLRHTGNNPLSSPNVINNYIIVPPDLINDPNFINGNKKRKGKDYKKRKNIDDIREKERPRRRKNRRKPNNENDPTDVDKNKAVKKTTRKGEELRPVNEVTRKNQRRKSKDKTKLITEKSSLMENGTNSIDAIQNSQVNSNPTKNKTSIHTCPFDKTGETKTCLNNESVYVNPSYSHLGNYYNYDQFLKTYQDNLKGAAAFNYAANNPLTNTYQQTYDFKNNAINNELNPHTNNQIGINGFLSTQPVSKNEVHLTLGTAPKSKEEEAVKEICMKFPGIPEDTVRKLIAHLKKQILNEQGLFKYQWPFNFDHLLPPQQFNKNKTPKRGRNNVNKGRQNKSKLSKNKNNNAGQMKQNPVVRITETNIEQTPTLRSNGTESSLVTTTEALIPSRVSEVEYKKQNETKEEVKEIPKIVETITKPIEEIQKSPKKSFVDEIIETTTARTCTVESNEIESTINNIQPKEHVSIAYGIIDDYYPDFTYNNKALLFQDEEYAITNLEAGRYHYTTDRSIGVSELSRERRKYESGYVNNNNVFKPENNNLKENKKVSPNNTDFKKPKTDREDLNQEIIEQLQFISPPVLELPDFETRMVERINYNRDYFDLNDKGSTYSDAKTTQYNKKLKASKSNLDSKKHDVETVFAKSRVVKYGLEQPAIEKEKETDMSERKTIVLAKSME